MSFELTGPIRSNPAGGFLDMTSLRCVGMTNVNEGKITGINVCEIIDKDGDKILSRNIVEGTKSTPETVAGTGKYEGLVRIATTESLGQFPNVKPGTFQGCNRQTGTYKLK